jgi:hypothetical protein
VGTSLVLRVVWALHLPRYHLLLLHLSGDVLVVALVVGDMVVDWHFLGSGIASVGWKYFEARRGGLRDQSLMLIGCFLWCLHQHSSRVL